MERQRLAITSFTIIAYGCCLLGVVVEAGAGDSFLGTPEQGALWELPLLGSSCDPCSPVCGEGHMSYKSACHALAADATILTTGAYDEARINPVVCTVHCFRADPVCGLDGVTYWCGAPEAECAGVEVAHEGYCDIWSGGDGAGSRLLHAAQSLQLLHMVWLVLAGLLIVVGLP